MSTSTIIYTHTDEAPALATHSFLPIVRAFTASSGINIELKDISLSGRILANFSECLSEEQRVGDGLAELGKLVKLPEANVIKLPNISASIPQLKAAIKELQDKGFAVPDYPEEPQSDEERVIQDTYSKVKGSAVNPVLREGNSDRRAPRAVKEYARKHPHRMGAWTSESQSHVAHMNGGDFFSNEKSVTMEQETTVSIVHIDKDGNECVLKERLALQAGEVIDATFMSKQKLIAFLENQVADAKEKGLLFSLHMKATMMKVSDPIIFGHAVEVFYKTLFEKHGDELDSIGIDVNNGFGDVESKISELTDEQQAAIHETIAFIYTENPAIAMVDSDRGITNLHVPSDVIIDASMPAMIRASGCMWNSDGETQDTKAVIPDKCYAGVYQSVIDFCKANGAFNPATMGSVSNVGLMAQKAEEYGSHDKTFKIESEGFVKVFAVDGETIFEHQVEAGDIWRMCQTKDAPVQDWVKLAVNRARSTGLPAVFWLDKDRPHDAALIEKVEKYLPEHDTDGLEFHTMSPADACTFSCKRASEGKDTISITGNVLRDYLTDLFPILEVGTSAKMLSIVPLMNGGGLFETGAGGSAPKHVQQFEKENHLRWDSLGEFLALAASFEHLSNVYENEAAKVLSHTLNDATTSYLLNNKTPSRKVGEPDNRTSHFYVAMYWAKSLANQTVHHELASQFAGIAEILEANETKICQELIDCQGESVDIGGYYRPSNELTSQSMRPSETFNSIVEKLMLTYNC